MRISIVSSNHFTHFALAYDVLLILDGETKRKGTVMKKISSNKLSLNKETLVTLSPDALETVNGGVFITPPITTRTIQKTIQYTRDLVTRLANCNGTPQAQ